MRQKRISTGIVKLHCLRVAERARGGVKVYFGGSIRADGYALLSGEECLRIDGVLWSSDWREYLPDALQDIESMLSLGYARSASHAVELLDGRSFGDWLDLDEMDAIAFCGAFCRDGAIIPDEVIEPITDALFNRGISGPICDAIYDSLLAGCVPSRGDLVRATACTDWTARKAIAALEECAVSYAEDYRIDRLVSEILAELA